MSLNSLFSSGRGMFYSLAIWLIFSVLPAQGQARENVNCVYNGGSRQIAIDYSGSGCRTLYNPGNGQHREIAWAKSNLSLCGKIANGVMSKSGRAAWSCSPDIRDKSGHSQAKSVKSHKKVGQRTAGDYDILKSSER